VEKNVDIAEIMKPIRNTVNIKGVDGTVFSISRINTVATRLYNKLSEDTKKASENVFKLQKLLKRFDQMAKSRPEDINEKELVELQSEINELNEDVKGSNDSYTKRQTNLIKYILEINGIEFDRKYWDEWDLGERSGFITACVEKDVDPKKKTG
jgi:uncharacterized phage infection (PIP) family protein YhgE